MCDIRLEALVQALVTFAIVVAVAAVLAVPAIVAILRKHPSWIAITLLTALLGWTGVGWVVALLWARTSTERRHRVKTRKAKVAKVRAASAAVPAYAGANDNSSAPAATDLVPDIIAPDVYEDWLEHGEAMQAEPARVAESASAPRNAPAGLAA